MNVEAVTVTLTQTLSIRSLYLEDSNTELSMMHRIRESSTTLWLCFNLLVLRSYGTLIRFWSTSTVL